MLKDIHAGQLDWVFQDWKLLFADVSAYACQYNNIPIVLSAMFSLNFNRNKFVVLNTAAVCE